MAAVLQPEHSRRTLRDSVRRLFAQTRGRNPGHSGMFDRAQNTSIQNATFNINNYGVDAPPAAYRDPSSNDDSDGQEAAQQNIAGDSGSPSGAQEHQSSPRRESPDVYVDLLLTKGRGYPLWIPSSNRSLPIFNRTEGVSIGDVGVLTPEGGFDFLFNVFHDSGHPINDAVGTPPGFIPFPHPVNSSNIQQFAEWNGGSYLSDASVTRIDDGGDTSKAVLRTAAPESAILMMPEDVHTTKMKSLFWLRQYFAKNLVVWYAYIKHTLGHDIENGDLRLVYGCRKSSGFGIATAFNAGPAGQTQLTFSIIDESGATRLGCPYRWSHIGSAEVKAGPSAMDRIDFPAPASPQNQCLFVNTIDMRVSLDTWQHIENLGTIVTDDSNKPAFSSTTPQYQAATQSQGNPTASGKTVNPTFGHRLQEGTFHPSSILHGVLRQIVPDADFYTVCDEDWSDLLTEDGMSARRLLEKVFLNSLIIDDGGIAYFSKLESNPTFEQGVSIIAFGPPYGVASNTGPDSQWKATLLPPEDQDSSMLIDLQWDPPTYSIVQSSADSQTPLTAAGTMFLRRSFGKKYGKTPTKLTESGILPTSSLDAPVSLKQHGPSKRVKKPAVEPSSSVLSTGDQSTNDSSVGKKHGKMPTSTNLTESGILPTSSLDAPVSLKHASSKWIKNPIVEPSSGLFPGDQSDNDS